jgi:hypothetical protein
VTVVLDFRQSKIERLVVHTPKVTVNGLRVDGIDTSVEPQVRNNIKVHEKNIEYVTFSIEHTAGCERHPVTHKIWIPECCLVVSGMIELSKGQNGVVYKWRERTYPKAREVPYTCTGPPPPEKPTGGGEKKEDKPEESSDDERGAMLRKPKSGDILALVEVRQGYKLRLFDPLWAELLDLHLTPSLSPSST